VRIKFRLAHSSGMHALFLLGPWPRANQSIYVASKSANNHSPLPGSPTPYVGHDPLGMDATVLKLALDLMNGRLNRSIVV
jgi:hypothetical protein